jgi:hypothetical protein
MLLPPFQELSSRFVAVRAKYGAPFTNRTGTAIWSIVRKNLREMPSEAEVYKPYLEKLDAQEKAINAPTVKQQK